MAQRKRIILCGVCFMVDCSFTRIIDEDDDGTLDAVDELHQLWIECQHSEMEKAEAAKLTVEEKRERIETAIAQSEAEGNEPVEIANLDELLGESTVKAERSETELKTDKDFNVDDILRKFADMEIQPRDENERNKFGHGH